MKLSKKQNRQLQSALALAKECVDWIKSPDVALCTVGGDSTTLTFERPYDDRKLREISTDCGSKFQLLECAVRELELLRQST